jgi:hypothetical protein
MFGMNALIFYLLFIFEFIYGFDGFYLRIFGFHGLQRLRILTTNLRI